MWEPCKEPRMARAEGRSMRKQRGYAPKWGQIMLDLENFYSERDGIHERVLIGPRLCSKRMTLAAVLKQIVPVHMKMGKPVRR